MGVASAVGPFSGRFPVLTGVVSLQAYIHTRMRAKTSDFLKVLNRARPDAEKKEMKTMS